MDRSKLIFALIIIAAVAIVGAGALINVASNLGGDGEDGDNPAAVVANSPISGSADQPTPVPPAEGDVVVLIQTSNTKEVWMDRMVEQFNRGDFRTENNRQIVIQVQHTGSTFRENLQPVGWSPSNQVWVDELNQQWQDTQGIPLITESCPGLLLVPIGIAMWRPMAEALGWPDEPISWEDITALARDPQGWASLGHPEWGELRYGHGHPWFSNSGRLSVAAEIHGALGSIDPLSFDNVWSNEVMSEVGAVQQAIAHYGRIDTALLDRMAERGPSYLHAVTNYEGNVIRWNGPTMTASDRRFSTRPAPFDEIVLIYPAGGTFWENHPLCALNNAPWVTPDQVEGLQIFRDFILEREQQAQLVETGIRPIVEGIPIVGPNSPLRLENGVNPAITPNEVPALPYPSADIMQNIKEMWQQVKKPSTVVLVIDTSASMSGEPMAAAIRGAQNFISQMQPQDELVVLMFNTNILELGAGQVSEVGEDLRARIGNLFPEGNTALYGATIQAVNRVNALREEDLANGEKRIYGIILMSDGENTTADATEGQMLNALPSGEDSSEVRFYTIAFGSDADRVQLQRMANRTNGEFYEGDVEDIEEIYFLISSEF
ncbi:MAG: VWA domain-containing protein [Anaerolineae bacterium]|nr:VWA domain-containing protein [Anaerolineae bacterium]